MTHMLRMFSFLSISARICVHARRAACSVGGRWTHGHAEPEEAHKQGGLERARHMEQTAHLLDGELHLQEGAGEKKWVSMP